MITTNNYNAQKISLDLLQDKKSEMEKSTKIFQFYMTEERHLFICAEDFN